MLSRVGYRGLGVLFETEPLLFFWQVMDPALLREEPWQSLFYLRTQLPAFDLYLAIIMHFFPRMSGSVFHATYLGLGLVLGISLFLLLDRFRLNRPLSLLIVVICVISPVTALYENWLFYEYPLAVLFCLSALFLHRYVTGHHRIDGIAFFTSVALISMFRVIFHLLWFGVVVALLVWVLPRYRRRTALCAAVPGILLLMVYLKAFILFGTWIPGNDVYGSINLASTVSAALPRDVVERMAAEKTISPILLYAPPFEDAELVNVIPLPAKTGIRILDERLKSTGWINMDSLWMAAVGKQMRQDGLVILRSYPTATLITFRDNLERYFLPADVGWPFGGHQNSNARVLSPLLKAVDLIMAGKLPTSNYAPTSYLAICLLLSFGIWRSGRWLRHAARRRYGNASDLTVIFAFGNIAYLSGILIFYACADQNRMLFEVFPLFIILLGSVVVFITQRFRVRARNMMPGAK
jgi:hypothetical protein